jgi:drug/metabolite transporter (DMT)-like permease
MDGLIYNLLIYSVPANTSIFQSVVAFVFILSVPLLREKVTLVKVVGVLFSLAGVVLIAVFSESKKDDKIVQTPLGYVVLTHYCNEHRNNNNNLFKYLVVSTLLFALLEVLFKKYASFKDDPASAWNGVRFVGLMGIHTIMWMWPPLIVLHFTRVETFEFPVLSEL